MEFTLLVPLILIHALAFALASVVYVKALLAVASITSSVAKSIAGVFVFLLFCAVMSGPLIYIYIKELSQRGAELAMLFFIAGLIPGLYYIFSIRIKDLQKAGYYASGKSQSTKQ